MLALAIVQGFVLDDDNGGRRLTTTCLGSKAKELVKRARGEYNIYNTHPTKKLQLQVQLYSDTKNQKIAVSRLTIG